MLLRYRVYSSYIVLGRRTVGALGFDINFQNCRVGKHQVSDLSIILVRLSILQHQVVVLE